MVQKTYKQKFYYNSPPSIYSGLLNKKLSKKVGGSRYNSFKKSVGKRYDSVKNSVSKQYNKKTAKNVLSSNITAKSLSNGLSKKKIKEQETINKLLGPNYDPKEWDDRRKRRELRYKIYKQYGKISEGASDRVSRIGNAMFQPASKDQCNMDIRSLTGERYSKANLGPITRTPHPFFSKDDKLVSKIAEEQINEFCTNTPVEFKGIVHTESRYVKYCINMFKCIKTPTLLYEVVSDIYKVVPVSKGNADYKHFMSMDNSLSDKDLQDLKLDTQLRTFSKFFVNVLLKTAIIYYEKEKEFPKYFPYVEQFLDTIESSNPSAAPVATAPAATAATAPAANATAPATNATAPALATKGGATNNTQPSDNTTSNTNNGCPENNNIAQNNKNSGKKRNISEVKKYTEEIIYNLLKKDDVRCKIKATFDAKVEQDIKDEFIKEKTAMYNKPFFIKAIVGVFAITVLFELDIFSAPIGLYHGTL